MALHHLVGTGWLTSTSCTASAFVRTAIFIVTGVPGGKGSAPYSPMQLIKLPSASGTATGIMGLPLYDAVGIVSAEMFWTMIETTVALFAICLPTIRGVVTLTQIGKYLGLSSIGRYLSSITSTSRSGTRATLDVEMGKTSDSLSSSCLDVNASSNNVYRAVSPLTVNVTYHDEKMDGLVKSASVSCAECGSHDIL